MLTTGPEQHTVEMLEPRLLLSSAPLPLPLNELDLGPVAWLTEPVSRGTTPGAADTGDPAGGDSATGIVISGVPAYYWYRGCGPTSAGMIIGYWDGHGYSNLVVGDAQTQNSSVNSMIASPEHYADYALPMDNYGTGILDDKSSTGGAHESNCVADWMKTSWSSRGNYYGWSRYSDMDNGLEEYARSMGYSDADAWNETWGGFTWTDLVGEIDAGRPMLFLVDTNANGGTDHIITAIGYDATTNQYAAYNTWDDSVHWYDFAPVSSGQPWGIYGATFFDPGTAEYDTVGPTAQVSAANVTEAGTTTYSFTVMFSDNQAVRVSTLDSNDVRVTGPNGFIQTATFLGVDVNSDGTPRTATYRITTPGGTWDYTDNGTYTVSLLPNAVTDTTGNFAPSGTLGEFTVDIIPPDTLAPTATLTVADISDEGPDTHTFTVTFSDDRAVDVSTLDGNDIRVIGPNGFTQTATFLGVDVNSDGTPRTATYRITAPGEMWDAEDNGTYAVSVLTGEVSDTALNFVPGGDLGTFEVDIAALDVIVDNLDAGFSMTPGLTENSNTGWAESSVVNEYRGSSYFTRLNGATATWTPSLPAAGNYEVYVWWAAGVGDGGYADRDSSAEYTVNHAGTSDVVIVDQDVDHGRWVLLDVFNFTADGTENVTLACDLTDQLGSPATSADAVRWTPAITPTEVIVDNLGAGFSCTPGFTGNSTTGWAESSVTDEYEGSSYFSKSPSPATATWTPTLSAPGTYQVYAWWSNAGGTADRDTAAEYIITHNGTTDTVTVDQKNTGGGQWVLLGTYEFAATGTENVTVSRDVASTSEGTAADAIRWTPTAAQTEVIVDNLDAGFTTTPGVTGVSSSGWAESSVVDEYGGNSYFTRLNGATATWTPVLPDAGSYEVFAWWSAELSEGGYADRDSSAEYIINHAGTSDVVTKDQDLNSGQWVSLGIFYFAADGTESVTLVCDLTGQSGSPATSADAIKWVSQS